MRTTQLISTTVCALGLAALSTTASGAQAPAPPGPPAAPLSSQAAPPRGSDQGIKVSGHWLIEIRNEDGTIASRVEFDNHLNTTVLVGGADALAKVLLGRFGFGIWAIRLTGSAAPPCPGGTAASGGPTTDCWLLQSSAPASLAGTAVSRTLTAGLGALGEVILTGSSTTLATTVATIDQVATHLTFCGLPSDCPNTANDPTAGRTAWLFTEQSLGGANPVPAQTVQPGQIVQVTVRIRFS